MPKTDQYQPSYDHTCPQCTRHRCKPPGAALRLGGLAHRLPAARPHLSGAPEILRHGRDTLRPAAAAPRPQRPAPAAAPAAAATQERAQRRPVLRRRAAWTCSSRAAAAPTWMQSSTTCEERRVCPVARCPRFELLSTAGTRGPPAWALAQQVLDCSLPTCVACLQLAAERILLCLLSAGPTQ